MIVSLRDLKPDPLIYMTKARTEPLSQLNYWYKHFHENSVSIGVIYAVCWEKALSQRLAY